MLADIKGLIWIFLGGANSLSHGSELSYILVFFKSRITFVKFLAWENTTCKELRPLELTSKVTTEFTYNGASRGLHKKRYWRIDVISELKCM